MSSAGMVLYLVHSSQVASVSMSSTSSPELSSLPGAGSGASPLDLAVLAPSAELVCSAVVGFRFVVVWLLPV